MLFLLFLLPMSGLVSEAFFGSHCDDMQLAPCTGGCSRGLQRDFNGVANRALPGHGYRNLTVRCQVLCARLCQADHCCFSFHYSERERWCELNGATASRYSMGLIERDGTIYYGPEEPSYAELLANGREPLTDCWHHTHESVASECSKTSQHLCLQWELDHASNLPSSWYADPDRLAVLSETGVTFHDLPVTAPSPGLCCSLLTSCRDPVNTLQRYNLSDRARQMKGCSDLAAHLCTLAELKEAYDHGYRRMTWHFFATPNRDVCVRGCEIGWYSGDECYQGTIANTLPPGPPGCQEDFSYRNGRT